MKLPAKVFSAPCVEEYTSIVYIITGKRANNIVMRLQVAFSTSQLLMIKVIFLGGSLRQCLKPPWPDGAALYSGFLIAKHR